MPFFEQNPLEQLAIQAGSAAAIINLGNQPEAAAIDQPGARLEAGQDGSTTSYQVIFDGPSGDGRETLFLPVGRWLLAARKAGRLKRCVPLSDGRGFYVEI